MAGNLAYRRFVEELSPAVSRRQLLAPGTALDAVTVVRLPGGADVELHIGQQNDGIPLTEGDSFTELCGDTGGLYLTINAAMPGNSITLIAFFGGGELERGA